ncbi:MAG: phospho-N-acetylmuramoyl-pentapeptide-transferase [Clostridiales bacterium]|nr:phospho-N-acetylmuramoyl-pentapeptide-transferase [Clostridiales bacterium]
MCSITRIWQTQPDAGFVCRRRQENLSWIWGLSSPRLQRYNNDMLQILLTALVALTIVWILGPLVIPMLARLKPDRVEREVVPEPSPQSSKKKKEPPPKPPAPTLGGVMVLLAVATVTLLFGLDGMEFTLPALVAVLAFGVLGFVDDFLKVRDLDGIGLRAVVMVAIEVVIAAIIAVWAYRSPLIGSELYLPISGKDWDIGFWYVPLVMLTILTEVNAARLSDGMDGLVTSVSVVYAIAQIGILAAMASFANQNGRFLLGDNFAGGAVFAAAVAGAGIGFLRYNTYPSRVQPGSSGSLAFGGAVAMLAILSRSILLLPLMSFCLLASIGSIVLQAFSKTREGGKKLFRAAPIHRHYELTGHPPSQIVSMYTILTAAICALCLLPYFR